MQRDDLQSSAQSTGSNISDRVCETQISLQEHFPPISETEERIYNIITKVAYLYRAASLALQETAKIQKEEIELRQAEIQTEELEFKNILRQLSSVPLRSQETPNLNEGAQGPSEGPPLGQSLSGATEGKQGTSLRHTSKVITQAQSSSTSGQASQEAASPGEGGSELSQQYAGDEGSANAAELPLQGEGTSQGEQEPLGKESQYDSSDAMSQGRAAPHLKPLEETKTYRDQQDLDASLNHAKTVGKQDVLGSASQEAVKQGSKLSQQYAGDEGSANAAGLAPQKEGASQEGQGSSKSVAAQQGAHEQDSSQRYGEGAIKQRSTEQSGLLPTETPSYGSIQKPDQHNPKDQGHATSMHIDAYKETIDEIEMAQKDYLACRVDWLVSSTQFCSKKNALFWDGFWDFLWSEKFSARIEERYKEAVLKAVQSSLQVNKDPFKGEITKQKTVLTKHTSSLRRVNEALFEGKITKERTKKEQTELKPDFVLTKEGPNEYIEKGKLRELFKEQRQIDSEKGQIDSEKVILKFFVERTKEMKELHNAFWKSLTEDIKYPKDVKVWHLEKFLECARLFNAADQSEASSEHEAATSSAQTPGATYSMMNPDSPQALTSPYYPCSPLERQNSAENQELLAGQTALPLEYPGGQV